MTVQSLLAFIEDKKRKSELFDSSSVTLDINGIDLPDCSNISVAYNETNECPILVLGPEFVECDY